MNIRFKTLEEKSMLNHVLKCEIFSIYVNGRTANLCFAESETNLAIRSLLIASLCSKLDNIVVSVCLVVKLRSYDTERAIFGSTFLDIT